MPNSIRTKLDRLNLVDRFLFDESMEDLETYQATVSILMENEIAFRERPETEKEFRVSPELRAIRLDVVGVDLEGKVYYTEMQKKNTGNPDIYQHERHQPTGFLTGIFGFYEIYNREHG